MAITIKQIKDALSKVPDDSEMFVYIYGEDVFVDAVEFAYDSENKQAWVAIETDDYMNEDDDEEDEDEDEIDVAVRAAMDAERKGNGAGSVVDAEFTVIDDGNKKKKKNRYGRSTKEGPPTP